MMICFWEHWRDRKVDFYFQSGLLVEVLTTKYYQRISCEIVITITSRQRKVLGMLNSFIVRVDKIDVKNVAKP